MAPPPATATPSAPEAWKATAPKSSWVWRKLAAAMLGEQIGDWTVLSVSPTMHSVRVVARCVCGRDLTLPIRTILAKGAQNCGCRPNRVRERLSESMTYKSWRSMLQRCTRPRHNEFRLYGGRGIRVCERWRAFENFLADMGERPSHQHSLDRIDNDGNYEPGNCRWATAKEQTRNRRVTRMLTFRGATRSLSDWAELIGMPRHTLHSRIVNYGWTAERALTEPVSDAVEIQRRATEASAAKRRTA